MKIPACVWHLIKLVPAESSLRYSTDGIMLHGAAKVQEASVTDGRILIAASWEENSPGECFIPHAVLRCLHGFMTTECDCGQGEGFQPISAFIDVGDTDAVLRFPNLGWFIEFPKAEPLKFPPYGKILEPEVGNEVTANFDPFQLARLFGFLRDMNCRRVAWKCKDNDSPLHFSGKCGDDGEVSVRGALMPLTNE